MPTPSPAAPDVGKPSTNGVHKPTAEEELDDLLTGGKLPEDGDEAVELPAAPAKKPAPEAAKPQHSDEALELAEYYGFDPVDVELMTPVELNAQLHRRTRAEMRRRWEERAAAEAPPAKPAAEVPADEFAQLESEGYDPKIVAAHRKQAAEIAALKKQLEDTGKSNDQRQQVAAAERLDDAFASLGDDAAAYYGDKSGFEMAGNSPEMLRRQLLIQAAKVDLKNIPSLRVLVNRLKAADKVIRPVVARPEPTEEEEEDPNPYARPAAAPNGRQTPPKDPRTGRFVPPTEREWDEGGLLRPSQRGRPGPDKEHSGYADPDEFDLG